MINIVRKIISFFRKHFLLNSFFLFLGSSIWFLWRTGTKPVRYVYPCQKFARDNMGLFGPPALIFLFHKFRHNPRFRRNIFVGLTTIIVSSYFIRNVYLTYKASLGKKVIAQSTNSKVVWITNPAATTQSSYSPTAGDPTTVKAMLDNAMINLTNTSTVASAWTKIFQDHNGGADYAAGEKIAIKVNFNNNWDCDGNGCPVSAVILAVLRQLIVEKNISPSNIIVYDASRSFPGYFDNAILNSYPDVQRNPDAGFSSTTVAGAHLTNILVNAKYLINMPLLRTHGYAGVTLSFKNHLGSTDSPSNFHNSLSDIELLNKNSLIKNKTILVIDDALYGLTRGGPDGMPNIRPNSLFISADPVAVDSVMIDFLQTQSANFGAEPRAIYVQAATDGLGNYATSCPAEGTNCSFSYSNIDLVRPTPTNCTPLGDIDCSGKVTALDLSTLLSKFNTNDVKSDLDDSGQVNSLDLFKLLQNFGK